MAPKVAEDARGEPEQGWTEEAVADVSAIDEVSDDDITESDCKVTGDGLGEDDCKSPMADSSEVTAKSPATDSTRMTAKSQSSTEIR